jgi:hypothetical protein
VSPWEPQISPEEIGRLEEARNGAQAHAGHVEYTCGRDSPAARWANHHAREAGRELYAATHPSGPYRIVGAQIIEMETGE